MKTDFKSLIELNDYFKEEKTCYEFLASQVWNEGKPVCPHCGSTHVYVTKSRSHKSSKKGIPEYRCANKECAKKFTATVGTIFQSSKIPLRTWYAAIFLITTAKKGISSVQLSIQLDVTQKTSWYLLHRIREMYKETAPTMLTGIVEADETYVGGKNKNRHADKKINYKAGYQEKTPVVGLLQRDGKVLTFVIPHTNAEIVQPLMQEYCAKDCTLITDTNNAYYGLNKDYNHITVKHKSADGDYKTDHHFHTNNIENFWSTFKRGIIGIYHYVSPKHLARYTTEFGYRYNNRKETSVEKFNAVVKQSAKKHLPYDKLIGHMSSQTLDGLAEKAKKEVAKKMQEENDFLDNIDFNNVPFIE